MNKGLFGFPKAAGLGAAAWVNFSVNGSGTVTVNSSMNVATVTRSGTGVFTVTFFEPLPSNFYAAVTMAQINSNVLGAVYTSMTNQSLTLHTVSTYDNSAQAATQVSVVVFA